MKKIGKTGEKLILEKEFRQPNIQLTGIANGQRRENRMKKMKKSRIVL